MTHTLHRRNRSAAMLMMALLLIASVPASVSGVQSIEVEAQATAVVEVEEGDNSCIKAAWANYNTCLVLHGGWICDLAFFVEIIYCASKMPWKA